MNWQRRGASSRCISLAIILAGLCLCMFGAVAQAKDHKLEVLYSFCSQHRCKDGSYPSGLWADHSGNLFGTTLYGGLHGGQGTIFELVGGKKYKLLYTFCPHERDRLCKDGINPTNLIIDTQGNLYGTTAQGGISNYGTVYELSPNADQTIWTYTALYSFCPHPENYCLDGSTPTALTYFGAASGAPYDGVSPLYGTTFFEGGGEGAVFKLTPTPGHPSTWSESVLHSFCSQNGCLDGAQPNAPLLADASGNLFGTTEEEGINRGGTIFELSPDKDGSDWTVTVLHSFCSKPNCEDGESPVDGVVADAAGNLYGTTFGGGRSCQFGSYGCGVVFKLIPNGVDSIETVLHVFCAKTDCNDGAFPSGPLLLDPSGNLFGTAEIGGGSAGGGTVFQVTGSSFHVLYHFCAVDLCADGGQPESSSLIVDARSNLLSTTIHGGAHGDGVVFRLKP